MARMKELDPTNQQLEMNMTPMIDCVFLLLIFFMIVSQMSSLDLESLALPYADMAQPPEDGVVRDARQITVNIRREDVEKKEPFVRIQGRKYDKEKLTELIRKEAIKSERENDPRFKKIKIYRLWVYVRCDRDARYEAVQWVFDSCSRNGVYKTILAASPVTK